jgi:hypothetical protein
MCTKEEAMAKPPKLSDFNGRTIQDQRAAATALRAGGKVSIVLPWRSYEHVWVAAIQALYPDREALRLRLAQRATRDYFLPGMNLGPPM